jgi:hypothetical protein
MIFHFFFQFFHALRSFLRFHVPTNHCADSSNLVKLKAGNTRRLQCLGRDHQVRAILTLRHPREMIRNEIYKIDGDYFDKEIRILEDIPKIWDVQEIEEGDSTELTGVVDKAESMVGRCKTIHHLKSEDYRKDSDHEMMQTAAPTIRAVKNRESEVATVSSKTFASAAEENIILRQSVENLTRDLCTSIGAIARLKADVAASPKDEAALLSMQSKLDGEETQLSETQIQVTLDQQSLDKTRILEQDNKALLKQNTFLQDEILQLRNYHSDLKNISKSKQNTTDLGAEEFQVIVDEGCAEAASSSLIVLERSTTDRLLSMQDAVDSEVQQPPTFESVTSSSLSVVSNGSEADSILLNEVETVASLKVQLKRAQRGLLALTSKRVTVSDLLLEISTLQAALDESEKIREDNESVLRAMRKEILTAQSQLLEDSDSAKRDFCRFRNLELLENVLLQFRVVIGKKEVVSI